MTHQPSKVSGSLSAAAGAVKENVGHAFGNKSMEAGGAADRAKGNAEVEAAKAKEYTKGTMDRVTGAVKDVSGSVVGDDQMKAEGKAEKVKGETKQEINK